MKRYIAAFAALLLVLSLAACNTSGLEEYKKASEKTEHITKGRTSGEFSVVTQFNTKNMTSEEIKKLNYYKDLSGSFDVTYDDDAEKSIFRNYLNMGGMGFDFSLFIDKDQVAMKLPVVGKYLKLNEQEMIAATDEENREIISQETIDNITAKWVSLMKEEDVFKGKDIVLTTPDGEVKTTEYVITLNDGQIKELMKYSVQVILKDENLKSLYGEMAEKNSGNEEFKSFDSLIGSFAEDIDKYEIENFIFKAYVDIDGYIVNEKIDLNLKVVNPEDKGLAAASYSFELKNWDINKDQEFEFPVLTEENTMRSDEMAEDMPDIMKDLFKEN
ncbi:MAG: hypothetical protein AAGU76_15975 [Sedimentibacter sp.]|uniref:hypothetical protein n=1 Tax=Sedimentibacter sp. TaxID=1960295 RepID=UPI0031593218